jgi:hypothetical protein
MDRLNADAGDSSVPSARVPNVDASMPPETVSALPHLDRRSIPASAPPFASPLVLYRPSTLQLPTVECHSLSSA